MSHNPAAKGGDVNRRDFLRGAAVAGAAIQATGSSAKAEPPSRDDLPRQGPKAVVRGKRAVASSQHPIVTQTMLDVLEVRRQRGRRRCGRSDHPGDRADRHDQSHGHRLLPVLGSEVRKDLSAEQLRHARAAPGAVPPLPGRAWAESRPARRWRAFPGFMPGHRRDSRTLRHEALESRSSSTRFPWAENGRPMDEFTRAVLEYELEGNTFFPSMREIYAPNGFSPSVGELWKNPALAQDPSPPRGRRARLLHAGRLGASHFVATANDSRLVDQASTILTLQPAALGRAVSVCLQGLRDRAARAAGAAGRSSATWCSAS